MTDKPLILNGRSSEGSRLVQVILAVLKTRQEIKRVDLSPIDYKILLDMLGHPCSTTEVLLHGAKILVNPDVSEDMLNLYALDGREAKVFVEDIWVVLHPTEETRLHRVLREDVI